MAPVALLGIDVGSSNTKVALCELVTGDDSGLVERAVVAGPTPATAEELVGVVTGLVADVCARAPELVPAAVGVASMAETGVPLDPDGRPLLPWVRWDGRRAGEEARGLVALCGREALVAATGVRPSAKVPLATWLWLRREHGAVHASMRWAGAADLVAFALSGELVTDHTLAGRTMAYRLPAPGQEPAGAFDATLLELAGLASDRLPRVVGPRAEGVSVVPAALGPGAEAWSSAHASLVAAGIPVGTPVVVAGHDHAVAAWAAGVRAPGDRADSVGTAEAVLTVVGGRSDTVAVADAGMSHVLAVGGREAILGGSSSAGAMLTWLARVLPPGGSLDDVLEALAASLAGSPQVGGPVVLPYLAGRQCPHPDPDAVARCVPETAVALELARATLEGVCLQARWMLAEQGRLGGVEPSGPVVVLGGAALAVPAWAAVKRCTAGEPARWVTAREPVASGAALVAGARAGLIPVVPDAPTLATEVVPDEPGLRVAADRALERFVDLAVGR